MRPVVQFKQFPIRSSDAFVGEYSLVFELTSWGGTNVWRGSSKSHGHDSRQIRAKVSSLEFASDTSSAFSERREFWIPLPNPTLHHRCLKSKLERHSKWGNMSWSHECERRIIFENLLGTNAVNFRGVDTFQQLHTSSVPWGERQHRGEVDRHCLALFCWRKAHCCFQIRMIGHFFRNYIWLHSLHAFSGPMHVPHAGWITARQSRPYRIKESFHIVGCKVDSPRSMHWFAKIHCSDWQLHPCCRLWQLLPK